jgi:hypothetical protein
MADNGLIEISGNWEKGWKELNIKFASNYSEVENN